MLLEALLRAWHPISNTCRDDQVETHLLTLFNAATTHQASLAPATVTQATIFLKNNWVTIYQAQRSLHGSKTVTQEGKAGPENLQLMSFPRLS